MANQLRVANYLVEQKVDLNTGSSDSPLAIAANQGHLSMVELLLEAGAEPATDTGQPAIHYALCGNRVEVVKLLIEKGAHLEAFDTSGNTALQAVIKMPVYKYAAHSTSLSDKQRIAYTRMLIEAAADINELNQRNGDSALAIAVQEKSHPLVDFLLKNKADPNRAGKQLGETALIHAVKEKDTVLLKKLLEAGADVNQADNIGYAPLHYAILAEAKWELVQSLIDAGADVNLRIGEDAWTPLHFWAYNPKSEQAGRSLYRAGASPISLAKGFPKGIDTRSLDIEKNTPLHILLEKRRHDIPIIREFFEHGVQTLPPEIFKDGVWFLMPPGINSNPDPGLENPPTELLPSLYPVFERSEHDSPPPGLANFIIRSFDDPYGDRKKKLPNMDKLRILRPLTKADGSQGWKTLNILYKDLAEASDPASDPELQWGDVVLFDLKSSRTTGNWENFAENTKLFLSRSSKVTFNLQLADLKYPATLLAESTHSSISTIGQYRSPYVKTAVRSITNIKRFVTYREDLDFSKVKIIRSAKDKEFTVNLTKHTEEVVLSLQEGDTVIVPRKEEHKSIILSNELDRIWISRPGTHSIANVVSRGNFEGREIEELPLARVVARHYSGYNALLPHPDFEKIRLKFPGENDFQEKVVSLSDEGKSLVPWGTIIELPLKGGTKPETWTGLSDEERILLTKLSKVTVTIQPEGMGGRELITGFTFPRYNRIATGELVNDSKNGQKRFSQPKFWDVLGDQFRGDNIKWDESRIILKNGDWEGTFIDQKVPDFLDGDVLQLFKAL